MNLLVTGGAGFIGANLLRRLANEPSIQKLVNLDCLTYAGNLENLRGLKPASAFTFEKVDLVDSSEVLRVIRQHAITHVIHLAAESHVDRSITDPDRFVRTNVVGTCHLLEACRVAWVGNLTGKRFLHVSTDEVYGSLGPTGCFDELSPYRPNSPYAASKASADMFVRAYYHTFQLPVILTHSTNNFGPYQYPEKLIPVVIQSVVARRPIPVYGDGMNVRDWIFVADHVEALWRVLQQGRVGETYHIGNRQEWTNLRLVEKVCDLIDELAPHLGGCSRGWIRFVVDRAGHDHRYALNALKIRRELGWAPQGEFEDSLRQTVDWYLGNQDWIENHRRES